MADLTGYYAIRLSQERNPNGDMWTAEHPQLLGCHVTRPDAQGAIDDLAAVREQWLDRARDAGRTVPPPDRDLNYELVLAPDHNDTEAQGARTAVLSAQEIETVEIGETTWVG